MPQMVAALNGLGGGASALVGLIIALQSSVSGSFAAITTNLAIMVGALTFSGSAVAALKLHGAINQRPQQLPYHAQVTGAAAIASVILLFRTGGVAVALTQLGLALAFGVLITMRVGR